MDDHVDSRDIKLKQSSKPTEIRRRFALLIGVRDYGDPVYSPLPNTINDVIAVEKILSGFGYTVRLLHSDQTGSTKPTLENIWGEFENMIKLTGAGDLLLVHFAGHGDLDSENAAYLVPGNARKSSLKRTAINLAEFKQELAASDAQAKILILDACHSGIGRDARGMSREFERHVYLEAEGTATLAACRQGEVAFEHDTKKNGAFTYYLLEGLQGAAARKSQRFITFDDLKDYVTNEVKSWAIKQGYQQWPNASTQLVGDPLLVELVTQSNHHKMNPFIDTITIREPARFIGREAEMRRLFSMLRGGSVVLQGEPKIGKSSMLWHLARNWDGEVIGPLNFMLLENQEDFYEQIAKALQLENYNWRTIRDSLDEREILLLIDELDTSPEKGFNYSELATFRAICEKNPDFKMGVVSRTPLNEVFPDTGKGSPSFNFLVPYTLGP